MGTKTNDDNATLEQLRFRKMVRELHSHGDGESTLALASRFGMSEQAVAKMIEGAPGAHADSDTIEAAAHAMDLHPDFFRVKDLQAFGSHTHFIGRSPFEATKG